MNLLKGWKHTQGADRDPEGVAVLALHHLVDGGPDGQLDGPVAAWLLRLPLPSLPRLAVMLPALVVAGRVLRWFRCAGMPPPRTLPAALFPSGTPGSTPSGGKLRCGAELQPGAPGLFVDSYSQRVRTDVIHPIPVTFMDQRGLRR